MREECGTRSHHGAGRGITPAHAGRILIAARCSASTRDHPRACGKNAWGNTISKVRLGSPPRMREELSKLTGIRTSSRITPAHAGRICLLQAHLFLYMDHPRACGKNPLPRVNYIYEPGSPPRMREEFSYGSNARKRSRITPAHAGRMF